MKVIESIFKFIWFLTCTAIIIGAHGVLYFLNNTYGEMNELLNIIIIFNFVFSLIIYLKFRKITMIIGIIGYWILGAFIAAIHYFPLIFITKNMDGSIAAVFYIISAISFSTFLATSTVFPLIEYIKNGGKRYVGGHHYSNPYTYGTPEYEAREIRNNLEELNRKL